MHGKLYKSPMCMHGQLYESPISALSIVSVTYMHGKLYKGRIERVTERCLPRFN